MTPNRITSAAPPQAAARARERGILRPSPATASGETGFGLFLSLIEWSMVGAVAPAGDESSWAVGGAVPPGGGPGLGAAVALRPWGAAC